jgi:hypothetical protein
VRIGSNLESEEQFSSWRRQFVTAKIQQLDVEQNDVAVEVVGQDGIVSIKRTDSVIVTEPDAPLGILTLDGKDLGRPILERIPAVAEFIERRDSAMPIVVDPLGTHWTAASGYSFFDVRERIRIWSGIESMELTTPAPPKEGNYSPPSEGGHFAQQNVGVVSTVERVHTNSKHALAATPAHPFAEKKITFIMERLQ